MEEEAPIRSAMVSRLPKFGGRPSTNGAVPQPNGSAQPATRTQDGKVTPPGTPRRNGLIRASSFSLKWKKDEGISSPVDGSEEKAMTPLPSLVKDVKNGAPATPKTRRSGSLLVAVSSPKAIPKQSLKMSPKSGTKLEKSPLNGGSKISQNGCGIPARAGSESRLVPPRLGSGSLRSSSQDSLSQSSESLKMMVLDNMVRSNSFTHFKQIPSPTCEPMIRSFSFNRAVELAKPLTNTQLRPPRGSFLKPPQLSNGRVGLGLSGSFQYNRNPPAASSLSNPSTPAAPSTPRALKKPLLPSCVLTKSLGGGGTSLGYKLTRPDQTKQQKALLPGRRMKGEDTRHPSTSEEPKDEAEKVTFHSDSDLSSGDGRANGHMSEQLAVETLEDMSLSSASSLDRVDTSEEFLDDFDSVGDVVSDTDLNELNRKTGSSTQTCTDPEISPMQDSQGPLMLSPDQGGGEDLHVSSVEMSPSNSSGGTYMWDEEGLEPLGGPGTHPLDNYEDSELNSMDILNNLDPSAAVDLDDDDLMLDVDLPEDGLHEADRMSHIDRSNRQGQRRKNHCWSGSDHLHSDGRSYIFQHYDGLKSSRISSRPVSSDVRPPGFSPALDEHTLENMSQDCCILKNQLLRLKTLLQLEDTDSPGNIPEEPVENTSESQLEVLIKEVQMLRDKLQIRDKTIAQLTLQCQQLQQQHTPANGRQVKCQCHHQRAPSSLRHLDKRTHHYDKSTQTYWRPPNHTGVLPPPLLSPWQVQGLTRPSMPQRRHTSGTTAFQPLSQRAPPSGKTSKTPPHPHRGPQ